MRLYPPAHVISRTSLEDDQVEGVRIPKGSGVLMSIIGMQRAKALWKNPEDFNPDRFLEAIPKQQYIPFGSGARMCIGNHFALMELQVILVDLIRNFDFKLAESPEKLGKTIPAVTLKPRFGMPMIVNVKN